MTAIVAASLPSILRRNESMEGWVFFCFSSRTTFVGHFHDHFPLFELSTSQGADSRHRPRAEPEVFRCPTHRERDLRQRPPPGLFRESPEIAMNEPCPPSPGSSHSTLSGEAGESLSWRSFVNNSDTHRDNTITTHWIIWPDCITSRLVRTTAEDRQSKPSAVGVRQLSNARAQIPIRST